MCVHSGDDHNRELFQVCYAFLYVNIQNSDCELNNAINPFKQTIDK